jgi:nitrogen fixation NifU-like protein
MSVDELQQLYRDIVLEHYRAPRGRTPLAHPNGRGLAVNATCGDQVEIEVELSDGMLSRLAQSAAASRSLPAAC